MLLFCRYVGVPFESGQCESSLDEEVLGHAGVRFELLHVFNGLSHEFVIIGLSQCQITHRA